MKESTECLSKQEVIHEILVKHSSQDHPLGFTEISRKAGSMGFTIGRKAIGGYMNRVVSITTRILFTTKNLSINRDTFL